MESKSPADLHTIKLFYEAVNDAEDHRTIGEHITQLLIDLYDCHLITYNGRILSYSRDELNTDANGDEYIVRDGIEIVPNEYPDLFY